MTVPLIETAPMRRSGKPLLLVLATITAALLGAISVVWFGDYRVNLTPSEPLGLWRIVRLDRPAAVGDLVFICPPLTATMRQARTRGYLRPGLCAGGVAPLIKTVVAVAGQRVEVGASINVDGRSVPSSSVAQRDGQGRPMVRFPGGTVAADYVFLHSPFSGSYDSRYFGPVPAAGILGLAREVLTYAP
ncbi:conjugative transfer signal peptidase TraF [Sinorhizobium terangae]|uniref:Conjugative transfer signal peptidase TraF n=1 Tax=Sinorhizobium terangae TaxID=110322 RepID=A0A6N7LD67_SINTE|nr:conjugative transfer signal peptidase TraF [Sinorhizobium terangae]MBB4189438.1 conjugative transfer signal peptidase TraF [Sinorhizobium terangae]MQX15803.1 conjugative transfer signal peptidase TraF [Sinorhizobium terangae]